MTEKGRPGRERTTQACDVRTYIYEPPKTGSDAAQIQSDKTSHVTRDAIRTRSKKICRKAHLLVSSKYCPDCRTLGAYKLLSYSPEACGNGNMTLRDESIKLCASTTSYQNTRTESEWGRNTAKSRSGKRDKLCSCVWL